MQHQTKIALIRTLILWGGIGYGCYYLLNTETANNIQWIKSTKASVQESIDSYINTKKNQLREHTIGIVNNTFSYKEEVKSVSTPKSSSLVEIKDMSSFTPKVVVNVGDQYSTDTSDVDVSMTQDKVIQSKTQNKTPLHTESASQGMIPPPINYGNIPLPPIPEPIKMKR